MSGDEGKEAPEPAHAEVNEPLITRTEHGWGRRWGPWIGLCVLGLVLTALFLPPPVPKNIRLAAGEAGGGYHAFALELRKELAQDGFTLEIVPSAGSVENQGLLRDRKVDVALIQGGTLGASRSQIQSVCSVFFEPLWVITSNEVGAETLAELRGRRIAIDRPGSGTRPLALTLLAANGIDADSATLLPLGGEKAAQALRDGDIDVLFTVRSAHTAWLAPLLATGTARLFDWSRAKTYAHKWSYLHALDIPPGLMDLERNIPREPKRIVAPAAALTFHADSHRGLVPPLIEACRRVQERGARLAPAGTFPSTRYVDAPLDDDAERYLEKGPSFLYRLFPISIAQTLDRLKIFLIPLLTLLFPLFKIGPPLYRWRMRARIYRWYQVLKDVDRMVDAGLNPAVARSAIQKIDRLEAEISAMRVPLSFADELYALRIHADYLRRRIRERKAQLTSEA